MFLSLSQNPSEQDQLRRRALIGTLVFFFGIVCPYFLTVGKAQAIGTFSKTLVRFDRMGLSATSTGTVCLSPTVTTGIQSVTVTFPASYLTSTTLGNWTVSTTNLAWPTGATALTGVATATNVSASTAGTVRFPVTTFTPTAGNVYCFNWTTAAALTQPGSSTASEGGSVASFSDTVATVGIDSGAFSTATLVSGGDQITVSATVPQTFSFAINVNTDTITGQTTAVVGTSGTPRTARVDTNAKNGWLVWAQDSNQGVKSAAAGNYTVASNCSAGAGTNTTLSAGTEGYNLGVTSSQTSGTGTITVATIFVGGSLGRGGGLCSANLQTIATSSGTANNAVLTLNNNLAISNITPAATDYTDLETYVAAGLF